MEGKLTKFFIKFYSNKILKENDNINDSIKLTKLFDPNKEEGNPDFKKMKTTNENIGLLLGNNKKITHFGTGINWNELEKKFNFTNIEKLKEAINLKENEKFSLKTVFEIKKNEFKNIFEDIKNSLSDQIKNQIEKEINISDEIENFKVPLNQILYGPPGTGKTYNTVNKALEIILDKNDPLRELLSKDTPSEDDRLKIKEKYDEFVKAGQIRFVTFHQSYSYEDFIEGIRAETQNGQLSYSVKSGIFKQICEVAGKDQNKPYVLIIDEINRGNISRIFGELITLIESSKREDAKEALTVQLPYSGDSFSVPKNIYLIGTMNTADRSLSRMDIALRRRFVFREMSPKPDLLEDINVDGIDIANMLSKMNEKIEVLLDKDQCIGHTYFLPLKDSSLDKLSEIFQKNIIPLLQEYFFDDFERIRWVLNEDGADSAYQFFKAGTAVGELFSDNARSKMPNKTSWKLNKGAFNKTESYKKIYE